VVAALEDAVYSSHDIYLLLVDFSSAFNKINQDTLLMVMYDLGFPTDALEVVKDLYTGATTTFQTPYGPTNPIAVDRGTLQGDSLSPFLFLIYMEPLLRWLHVGCRGCKFGSLREGQRNKHHLADVVYADDLTIFTNNPRDLKKQAGKLSLWAIWADMDVQPAKTLVTGALHSRQPNARAVAHSSAYDCVELTSRLKGKIMVQGAPVKFIPPTEPFTLLGVMITVTLDWNPQYLNALKIARHLAEKLSMSFASTTQKVRLLNSIFRPKLAYPFCIAPYTTKQVDELDKILTTAFKVSYDQGKGYPSALARAPLLEGGWRQPHYEARTPKYAHRPSQGHLDGQER
jgi:hypothetical protein